MRLLSNALVRSVQQRAASTLIRNNGSTFRSIRPTTSLLNKYAPIRSFASQSSSNDLSSEFSGIVLDTELDIDFQDQGMYMTVI